MKKLFSILVLAFVCVFGLVACGDSNENKTLPQNVKEAQDFLKQLYEKDAEITSADYTRITAYKELTLDWTVNVSEISVVLSADGKTVTIDVPDEAEAEIAYVLKVVIKDKDGNSAELTWNHKVPKFQVLTWDQYFALEAGKAVAVEGIVTAIIGKAKGAGYNCLYLQDKENKGAYYVYGSAADPSAADAGIEVGMTVRCTGEKDIYSGTHEIKNGVFKVVDSTIKTVTPVDYTELFTNAKDLKDASITAAQGLLVTLKGVTIDSVTEANGYYNFKLAGKQSYIRISSSVCPLTKDEQATFKANFASHIGYTANATGVICVYDNNFYYDIGHGWPLTAFGNPMLLKK